MSKVICDVCGTTYPETAQQCPICGCAKNTTAQTIAGEASEGGYAYVKGGRFSKSNVKKRTMAQGGSGNKSSAQKNRKDEDAKSNRGLVVTAIVLLLAIIGVVIYIALRFFAPLSDLNADNTTNTINTSEVSLALCLLA